MQRIGLALFGTFFALLFLGVGISVGIESPPAVPSGDVAVIEGAAPGLGVITRAEFEQEMRQRASLGELHESSGPGDSVYAAVKRESLSLLISTVWMRSEAIFRGVPVTAQEIAHRLRPEESLLRENHFTRKTMDERASEGLSADHIMYKLEEETSPPTEEEARTYYEENPSGESFAEARKRIFKLIAQSQDGEVFNNVEMEWRREWQARTHCAEGFVVEECANYPLFDHSSFTPAVCYEPGPKSAAEECAAPVRQPRPAQPGSVRFWHPEGERLVQRAVPPGGGEAETSGE